MLSVAGIASLVCDALNADGKNIVNKDLIVKAMLLHDMGKILKFDFTRLEIFDPEDRNRLDELKSNQIKFRDKYGLYPDVATIKIVSELKQDAEKDLSSISNLIEDAHWEKLITHFKTQNLDAMICCYSDMRVGPFGILTLEERINDLKNRRPQESHKLDKLLIWGQEAEKKLEELAGKNLNFINDKEVRKLTAMLKMIRI